MAPLFILGILFAPIVGATDDHGIVQTNIDASTGEHKTARHGHVSMSSHHRGRSSEHHHHNHSQAEPWTAYPLRPGLVADHVRIGGKGHLQTVCEQRAHMQSFDSNSDYSTASDADKTEMARRHGDDSQRDPQLTNAERTAAFTAVFKEFQTLFEPTGEMIDTYACEITWNAGQSGGDGNTYIIDHGFNEKVRGPCPDGSRVLTRDECKNFGRTFAWPSVGRKITAWYDLNNGAGEEGRKHGCVYHRFGQSFWNEADGRGYDEDSYAICMKVSPTPQPTRPPPSKNEVCGTMAMSGTATLIASLSTPGHVDTWGYQPNNILGNNEVTSRDQRYPISGGLELELGDGILSLAICQEHGCATLMNGELWCWGLTNHGRLGVEQGTAGADGSDASNRNPFRVDLPGPAQYVACTITATVVSLQDGTIMGTNWYAVGAPGATYEFRTFSPDPGPLGEISGLKASMQTSTYCAIIDDIVKCWGSCSSPYGLLGNGCTSNSDSIWTQPMPVTGVESNVRALMIDTGDYYFCGLFSDDTVKCWGRLPPGFLSANQETVTQPTTIKNIPAEGSMLACSATFACVSTRGETSLQCWGTMPTDDDTVQTELQTIDVGGDVQRISAGSSCDDMCVQLQENGCKCWGRRIGGTVPSIGSSWTGDWMDVTCS